MGVRSIEVTEVWTALVFFIRACKWAGCLQNIEIHTMLVFGPLYFENPVYDHEECGFESPLSESVWRVDVNSDEPF